MTDEEFWAGAQWTPEQIKQMQEKPRPALVINRLSEFLNIIAMETPAVDGFTAEELDQALKDFVSTYYAAEPVEPDILSITRDVARS